MVQCNEYTFSSCDRALKSEQRQLYDLSLDEEDNSHFWKFLSFYICQIETEKKITLVSLLGTGDKIKAEGDA